MVFSNITMNLTALNNLTAPSINTTGTEVFSNIVSGANTATNDLLIFGSLIIIFIVTYLTLTDRTPFGNFGFNDFRGISITLGVCAVFGLKIVSVGWSPNFFAVGIFGTAWLLSYIGLEVFDNPE